MNTESRISMKYYPVKFQKSITSCVWSCWLPGGHRGSVVTYGHLFDCCSPLVSELSIFNWIDMHFSRHPDHFVKNQHRKIKPRI